MSNEQYYKKLSRAEHYKKLVHFAILMVQGKLVGRLAEVQQHYAGVINDEVIDFISLSDKKALDVGGYKGVFSKTFSEEFGANPINLDPFDCTFDYKKDLKWPESVRGIASAAV